MKKEKVIFGRGKKGRWHVHYLVEEKGFFCENCSS